MGYTHFTVHTGVVLNDKVFLQDKLLLNHGTLWPFQPVEEAGHEKMTRTSTHNVEGPKNATRRWCTKHGIVLTSAAPYQK